MDTAMALSERHLNNQINEARIILDALNGKKAWSRHPAVLQYRGYEWWLDNYLCILKIVQERGANDVIARIINERTTQFTPEWHCAEYYTNMKKRLYTKNPEHYKQWEYLGTSLANYYWSADEQKFIKYINGKRIE